VPDSENLARDYKDSLSISEEHLVRGAEGRGRGGGGAGARSRVLVGGDLEVEQLDSGGIGVAGWWIVGWLRSAYGRLCGCNRECGLDATRARFFGFD
jgi:hypothetical protein